ncbi:MAG: thiol:disulfide interchange protein DsbA/DsbL [Pseudomonadales bacterium]|jgi:thiol:disulfide interchange protein DsbA|nr:thiol:disulfide interchange protein DsbA/DsbL [Pseudomonadales bacterium]
MLHRAIQSMLFAAALVAAPIHAAENLIEPYRDGEQYFTLPVPVATGNEGVTVTEFFSYACIHCFEFDAELSAWEEGTPDDVTLERVPAVFSRSWMLFAQAYYVARACDVLPATHTAFFRAIHLERRRFATPDDVAAFYEDVVAQADLEGASCTTREDFRAAFDSFGVSAAVQQSIARGRAYQANGVPAMIVDGTWRTDGRSAGSNAGMLEVVDFLVRRARAGSAPAAPSLSSTPAPAASVQGP